MRRKHRQWSILGAYFCSTFFFNFLLSLFGTVCLPIFLLLSRLGNLSFPHISLVQAIPNLLRYHLLGSFPGRGSFAVQFGDHFQSGDHLRACTLPAPTPAPLPPKLPPERGMERLRSVSAAKSSCVWWLILLCFIPHTFCEIKYFY